MDEIKKAIIPLAGLSTRHLPLSKILPKEFIPLADKPLIQYILEEVKAAGVEEVVFVVNSSKKTLTDYFKKSPQLEKILEERREEELLQSLHVLEDLTKGLTLSYVADKPMGDGHAVLQARKLVGDDPCFVLYPDDIIESKTPAILQLAQVFRTSQKPTIGLFQVSKEKLSSYGVVAPEKIASRLFKIKNIIEKPLADAPSNLAITGRSILTPEVFDYLKKARPNKKGEVSLTQTLGEMVKDGKIVYGYECDGRWWECGNKEGWFQSFVHFAVNHPQYGREVRNVLKQEKLF